MPTVAFQSHSGICLRMIRKIKIKIDNFAIKDVIHSQNLKHLRMKKVFK